MFRTYSALVYYVLSIFSRKINSLHATSLSRFCLLIHGLALLIELHCSGFGKLCPKIFI